MDYMDKQTTNALKGIALIFMFAHHFFTFPEWYVSGISYPELELFAKYFCEPLKICVPVFAFLTGYFYFFSKNKTFHYSLKKATDVLISYWAVFFPFLILALVMGCYRFDFLSITYEMFALKRSIMIFCWYVTFYCCAIFLLPLLTRISTDEPVKESIVLIVLPVLLCKIFTVACKNSFLLEIIHNIEIWFPCIATGYLFSKYKVFNVFDDFFNNPRAKVLPIFIYFLLACIAVGGRYICTSFTLGSVTILGTEYSFAYSMDIVYAPMFIYGTAKLLQYLKKSIIFRCMEMIGEKSLLMWFIHCIFFNVCKEKTQGILYFPKNPVLVLLFGLLLCFGLSALIDLALRVVLKYKNSFLDRIHEKALDAAQKRENAHS